MYQKWETKVAKNGNPTLEDVKKAAKNAVKQSISYKKVNIIYILKNLNLIKIFSMEFY